MATDPSYTAVEAILAHRPHWLVRNGNTIMLIVAALLLWLASFISWPETIRKEAVLKSGGTKLSVVMPSAAGIWKGLAIELNDGKTVIAGLVDSVILLSPGKDSILVCIQADDPSAAGNLRSPVVTATVTLHHNNLLRNIISSIHP